MHGATIKIITIVYLKLSICVLCGVLINCVSYKSIVVIVIY